jgi:SAM-dependent methyltransferase
MRLRVVYLFSPSQFWNLRSREINNSWYDDDADYQIMLEVIRSTGARSCLEIGCNGGRFSRHLVGDVDHLACQDISSTAIELCRKSIPPQFHSKVRFDEGFIETLYGTLPDGSFDLMISNRVLSALKPSEIGPTLSLLARLSRNLLINELLPGEPGATYYWFAHNYDQLLADRRMTCTREIVSESASFVQKFRLYQRNES